MPTSYDVARAETSDYEIAGSGWVTFAAVLLGFAGTFRRCLCGRSRCFRWES
jgi:hypothetical protein